MDTLSKLKDNFDVVALLTSNETCVSATLNYDVVISHAFEQLPKSNKRSNYYYIIAKHLKIHPNHQFPKDYRLLEHPEEFIQSALGDEVEQAAFLMAFEALLGSVDGKKAFSTANTGKSSSKSENKSDGRVFTKLLTFLKNSLAIPNSNLPLKVLQLLSKSSVRPQLSTHANSVCMAILNAVDNFTNREELAVTFALYASLLIPGTKSSSDTSSNANNEILMISWKKYFVDLTIECGSIVHAFGIIDTHREEGVANKWIPFQISHNIQSRTEKAIYLMNRFVSACAILKQMLVYGCSTGHVGLDLTVFIPLSSWLYEHYADLNASDPVNHKENPSRFTPIDISLVVTKMKIALIEVTSQLFIINPPSLFTVARALYKPVAALSYTNEARNVSSLKLALTQCLGNAAKCFPTVVVDNMESGSHAILTWLQADVLQLTSVSSLTSEVHNIVDTELTQALIISSEQVLLHCAAALLPKIRQSYEDLIGQVLLCLSRGLLYPQYTDRRMHRCDAEHIRQDTVLQNAFLRLALAEVLIPSAKVGISSGNVSLLKHVAQNCLGHATTCGEASRILLVLGALVNPSTMSLPAIPAIDVARGYVNGVNEYKEKLVNPKTNFFTAASSNDSVITARTTQFKSVREDEDSDLEAPSKRKRVESEEVQVPEVQVPRPKLDMSLTYPTAPVSKPKPVVQSSYDSDEELPDL